MADLILTDTQLDLTVDEVISKINAKGDLNTVLLTATVTDTDPQRSLDIAQSVSKQFVDLVSTLETPPGSTTPSVTMEVTSAAALNPNPVAPRPIINLGSGVDRRTGPRDRPCDHARGDWTQPCGQLRS